MTRTLNISLNVPDSYGIEELTRQLTEYGERLISRRNRVQKSKKRRSQTFLKGQVKRHLLLLGIEQDGEFVRLGDHVNHPLMLPLIIVVEALLRL